MSARDHTRKNPLQSGIKMEPSSGAPELSHETSWLGPFSPKSSPSRRKKGEHTPWVYKPMVRKTGTLCRSQQACFVDLRVFGLAKKRVARNKFGDVPIGFAPPPPPPDLGWCLMSNPIHCLAVQKTVAPSNVRAATASKSPPPGPRSDLKNVSRRCLCGEAEFRLGQRNAF